MTELEAAVERVNLALKHPETPSCCVVFGDDLRTILHALAEANERASLLQTELNAYRRAVNGKPARETIMRDAGRGPISRLLNPQQEGRDHGR